MLMNRGSLLLLSILICHPLPAALPDHSVSPSRQFVIYGANTTRRGAVSQIAEQTKANLLKILGQPDRWKTPIVVNLQSPQANVPELPSAELRFSQTGSGLKLQLDLTVGQDADASLIERELLRAILLEMIYRSEANIAPGSVYVEPPDWLLDGVLALTPGRDQQPLIQALALSRKIMPLEEFLRQRPALLDSPGRTLYRAYSFAFVQLLLEGTDGSSRLLRYIDNLSSASSDPLADLRKQFPLLSGDVDEIWQSRVARLSATRNSQLLGFDETEQQLGKLLRIKIAGTGASARTTELSDFLRRKLSPAEKIALDRLSGELLLLGARANPVMRPIVLDYQRIATLLVSGKRRKLSERLARLKTTRAELTARMSEIEDYLNWFEATQSKATSETFADYLKAAGESLAPVPRRRDALSAYLDSLEGQF